jgi:uncharacterized protein (TIGR03437 family)
MPKLKWIVSVLVALACGQAQPEYTIQNLGTLSGMPTCFASALSQSGIVTGYCVGANLAAGNSGFLYRGNMTPMSGQPQLFLLPSAVNNSGAVVGGYVNATYSQLSFNGPFLYQNGAFQPTFTQASGVLNSSLAPFALSDSGQICGSVASLSATSSWNYLNFQQAWLLPVAGGQPTQLLPPAGSQYAGALTQSANGTWVGGGVGSPGAYQPALWHNGTIQVLPRLAGYASSFVSGVNDSGLAAGSGYNISTASLATGHAALFSNGAATDLGVLPGDQNSIPTGINDSGQVVGWSTPAPLSMNLQFDAVYTAPSANTHAFLYTGGTLYDLTKLLVNGTGWQLGYAVAINSAGQITGTGLYQNQQAVFLLTPVAPAIASVEDAASLSTRLAPGSAASVFGTNLPTDPSAGALVGTLTAQVLLATATQWNIVIPAAASVGATTVQIGASAPFNITLAQYAPALFSNGQGMAMALRATSTGGSTGTITASNPALPGDIVTIYGTGFGSATASAITVVLAGVSIAPSSMGPVSGSPGTYQVLFTVPATILAGNQKISVTAGGQSSNTLALPVGAVVAPGPVISAVENGASFQNGFPVNAYLTITGANLATVASDVWDQAIVNGQLPTLLDGVSVTVGGLPAYISYVSPVQINAVAPTVAAGPATVVVKNSLGTSAAFSTTAQTYQPALFLYQGHVVATNYPDYSYASTAQPGAVLILWGTGFGPASPPAPVGAEVPSTAAYPTASPVTVTVGGVAATVYGAALAPGYAALYQVAIQVPSSLANGDYALVATINGVSSPSSALITIQK